MGHIPPVGSSPRLGDTPPTDLQNFQATLYWLNNDMIEADTFSNLFSNNAETAVDFAERLSYAWRLAQTSTDIPAAAKADIDALMKQFQAYAALGPNPPAGAPAADLTQMKSTLTTLIKDAGGAYYGMLPPFGNLDQFEGTTLIAQLATSAQFWNGGAASNATVAYLTTVLGCFPNSAPNPNDFPNTDDYNAFCQGMTEIEQTLKSYLQTATQNPRDQGYADDLNVLSSEMTQIYNQTGNK